MKKSRKELPNELVLKKRTAFESVFAFTEDTTLVSYAPKTNKTVVLLSTMHNKEEINTGCEKKNTDDFGLQRHQGRSGYL